MIEERDIMMWALGANDPDGWLDTWQKQPDKAKTFLDNVDGTFKHVLIDINMQAVMTCLRLGSTVKTGRNS